MMFLRYQPDPSFTDGVGIALRLAMKEMAKLSPDSIHRICVVIGEGTNASTGWGVIVDTSGDVPNRDFKASERSGIAIWGFETEKAAEAWLEKLSVVLSANDDQCQFSSWRVMKGGKHGVH